MKQLKQSTSFRISIYAKRLLMRMAKDHGISQSAMLEVAIRGYYDTITSRKENEKEKEA